MFKYILLKFILTLLVVITKKLVMVIDYQSGWLVLTQINKPGYSKMLLPQVWGSFLAIRYVKSIFFISLVTTMCRNPLQGRLDSTLGQCIVT